MPDPTLIETGTDHLLAHRDGRVAVLTLNRPEARNAQSGEMMAALADLLPQLADDDDVGCLVVTGAGRAFCAGGDVKGFAEGAKSAGAPLEERVRGLRRAQRATTGALYEFPKPTIAAIPGPAAGAGLSLALACDLRTMADDAFLTTAFRNIGFSGDHAGSWFLTNIIGTARARELYYTADRVGAERSLELGLVNHVFPADALQEETLRLARHIAAGPPIALGYMKENLNRAQHTDVWTAFDLEADRMWRTGMTADHKEAVQAFVEKRPPSFQGR